MMKDHKIYGHQIDINKTAMIIDADNKMKFLLIINK